MLESHKEPDGQTKPNINPLVDGEADPTATV